MRNLHRPLAAALLVTGLLAAAACSGGDSDSASAASAASGPATGASTASDAVGPDGRPELPRREPSGPAVDRHVEVLPPGFEPVVWTDLPPRPALDGPLAANQLIENAQIVGEEELEGAEDVAVGLDGHLYTATADGGIWRLTQDAGGGIGTIERVAALDGRALGLAAYSRDVLIAAVVEQGIMAVNVTTGDSWVLTDRIDGNLIFFADEVTIADDGTIYFTEASTVYLPGFPNDFLDGRPSGRLLRYEPATGVTDVVADGLYFANGVDVAADESHVLVAESFRFRLTRVWLDDGREGTTEQFGPSLVNGPDNIVIDDRGRVWVGGSDLRSDAVDALATSADLRRQIAALPPGEGEGLRGQYGFAQVLSPEGEPVFSFHDTTGRFWAVSSALPHDGHVTFGSLADRGLARLPLPTELS
ncbi:SMP-30/gluconolactonase/LRE family protein [Parafrankia elaeagni]|uniref:SMP-30/gluconolactonase/LRE family protein n=1 Tax=Parafrankia elaeagni TaxID=222534 RepID=UPI0003661D29|nr:SMP-30/gluconolactonase/LRE family protein [Parafrankia elaeagni]